MIKRSTLIFMCFVFLSTGCIEKEILDEIQLATAIGIDLKNEHEIEVTAVVPIYSPDKKISNDTSSEIAPISKEVRAKLNMESSKPYTSGKIEVALFNRILAEKGILNYIDTLHRDPTVGSRVLIAIVEENAKNLLSRQYGEQDNGLYLSDLLENNIETGLLPKTNLHTFFSTYYNDGIDPFLPILTQKGDEVKLSGIAFFKGEKMVLSIDRDMMFIFKILLERKSKLDTFLVKLDEGEKLENSEYASVVNVKTRRHYTIDDLESKSKILISLDMDANVREYSGKHISKTIKEKIEKLAKSQLENQALHLINKFQKYQIDPLGIGYQVKSRSRSWDKDKWNDIYPNIDVIVNINVDVTETGVIK